MNIFKCYYCQEGEQWEISLVVFNRFCRFSKGAFRSKSLIATERKGRLKTGKLLNLIGHVGNKTRQVFNIITLIFREQNVFKRQTILLTQLI